MKSHAFLCRGLFALSCAVVSGASDGSHECFPTGNDCVVQPGGYFDDSFDSQGSLTKGRLEDAQRPDRGFAMLGSPAPLSERNVIGVPRTALTTNKSDAHQFEGGCAVKGFASFAQVPAYNEWVRRYVDPSTGLVNLEGQQLVGRLQPRVLGEDLNLFAQVQGAKSPLMMADGKLTPEVRGALQKYGIGDATYPEDLLAKAVDCRLAGPGSVPTSRRLEGSGMGDLMSIYLNDDGTLNSAGIAIATAVAQQLKDESLLSVLGSNVQFVDMKTQRLSEPVIDVFKKRGYTVQYPEDLLSLAFDNDIDLFGRRRLVSRQFQGVQPTTTPFDALTDKISDERKVLVEAVVKNAFDQNGVLTRSAVASVSRVVKVGSSGASVFLPVIAGQAPIVNPKTHEFTPEIMAVLKAQNITEVRTLEDAWIALHNRAINGIVATCTHEPLAADLLTACNTVASFTEQYASFSPAGRLLAAIFPSAAALEGIMDRRAVFWDFVNLMITPEGRLQPQISRVLILAHGVVLGTPDASEILGGAAPMVVPSTGEFVPEIKAAMSRLNIDADKYKSPAEVLMRLRGASTSAWMKMCTGADLVSLTAETQKTCLFVKQMMSPTAAPTRLLDSRYGADRFSSPNSRGSRYQTSADQQSAGDRVSGYQSMGGRVGAPENRLWRMLAESEEFVNLFNNAIRPGFVADGRLAPQVTELFKNVQDVVTSNPVLLMAVTGQQAIADPVTHEFSPAIHDVLVKYGATRFHTVEDLISEAGGAAFRMLKTSTQSDGSQLCKILAPGNSDVSIPEDLRALAVRFGQSVCLPDAVFTDAEREQLAHAVADRIVSADGKLDQEIASALVKGFTAIVSNKVLSGAARGDVPVVNTTTMHFTEDVGASLSKLVGSEVRSPYDLFLSLDRSAVALVSKACEGPAAQGNAAVVKACQMLSTAGSENHTGRVLATRRKEDVKAEKKNNTIRILLGLLINDKGYLNQDAAAAFQRFQNVVQSDPVFEKVLKGNAPVVDVHTGRYDETLFAALQKNGYEFESPEETMQAGIERLKIKIAEECSESGITSPACHWVQAKRNADTVANAGRLLQAGDVAARQNSYYGKYYGVGSGQTYPQQAMYNPNPPTNNAYYGNRFSPAFQAYAGNSAAPMDQRPLSDWQNPMMAPYYGLYGRQLKEEKGPADKNDVQLFDTRDARHGGEMEKERHGDREGPASTEQMHRFGFDRPSRRGREYEPRGFYADSDREDSYDYGRFSHPDWEYRGFRREHEGPRRGDFYSERERERGRW